MVIQVCKLEGKRGELFVWKEMKLKLQGNISSPHQIQIPQPEIFASKCSVGLFLSTHVIWGSIHRNQGFPVLQMDGMTKEDESSLLCMAEVGRNSQKIELYWQGALPVAINPWGARSTLKLSVWVCAVREGLRWAEEGTGQSGLSTSLVFALRADNFNNLVFIQQQAAFTAFRLRTPLHSPGSASKAFKCKIRLVWLWKAEQ